jgi:hypothetical protein
MEQTSKQTNKQKNPVFQGNIAEMPTGLPPCELFQCLSLLTAIAAEPLKNQTSPRTLN